MLKINIVKTVELQQIIDHLFDKKGKIDRNQEQEFNEALSNSNISFGGEEAETLITRETVREILEEQFEDKVEKFEKLMENIDESVLIAIGSGATV